MPSKDRADAWVVATKRIGEAGCGIDQGRIEAFPRAVRLQRHRDADALVVAVGPVQSAGDNSVARIAHVIEIVSIIEAVNGGIVGAEAVPVPPRARNATS